MAFFASQNYKRVYYGKIGSNGCLLCFFFALVTLVLPFFLAYSTNRYFTRFCSIFLKNYKDFWLSNQIYYEQPDVTLLNRMLFQVKQGDQTYTFSNIIPYFYNKNTLRSLNLKVEKKDDNNDGLVDLYTVSLGFVPENINAGINIEIFLLFDYRLEKTVKLQMQSLAYISLESTDAISRAYVIGDLLFKQYEALPSSPITRTVYNTSVFDEIMADSYNIVKKMNEYSLRNESTYYKYESLISTGDSVNYTEIIINVYIPPHQMIKYVPSLLENVKFSWLQYFSLLVPIYLAFRWILIFIFRYKLAAVYPVEDKELPIDLKNKFK